MKNTSAPTAPTITPRINAPMVSLLCGRPIIVKLYRASETVNMRRGNANGAVWCSVDSLGNRLSEVSEHFQAWNMVEDQHRDPHDVAGNLRIIHPKTRHGLYRGRCATCCCQRSSGAGVKLGHHLCARCGTQRGGFLV